MQNETFLLQFTNVYEFREKIELEHSTYFSQFSLTNKNRIMHN